MAKTQKSKKSSQVSETQMETSSISPKRGFNTDKLEIPSDSMARRSVNNRVAVYMDLEYLKKFDINLDEWLKPYASWIGIKDEYDEAVIRVFYSNLSVRIREDDSGNEIGLIFETKVRGQTIFFDDESLNRVLGIQNPIYNRWEKYEKFPEEEFFNILGINDCDKKVPASMKDEYRIVHHAYSRLMVNKAGTFTSLTGNDNPLLALLIKKVPLNPGMIICQQMRKFLEDKTSVTTFPYPQLVSFLLKMEGVWGIQNKQNEKKIEMFDLSNLKRMKISIGTFIKNKKIKVVKKSTPVEQPVQEKQYEKQQEQPQQSLQHALSSSEERHENFGDHAQSSYQPPHSPPRSESKRLSEEEMEAIASKVSEKLAASFSGISKKYLDESLDAYHTSVKECFGNLVSMTDVVMESHSQISREIKIMRNRIEEIVHFIFSQDPEHAPRPDQNESEQPSFSSPSHQDDPIDISSGSTQSPPPSPSNKVPLVDYSSDSSSFTSSDSSSPPKPPLSIILPPTTKFPHTYPSYFTHKSPPTSPSTSLHTTSVQSLSPSFTPSLSLSSATIHTLQNFHITSPITHFDDDKKGENIDKSEELSEGETEKLKFSEEDTPTVQSGETVELDEESGKMRPPRQTFEELLDLSFGDIMVSVEPNPEDPENSDDPLFRVQVDSNRVHNIIRTYISHFSEDRSTSSAVEDSEDPFNLSPIIEEFSNLEKRFNKWLKKKTRRSWKSHLKFKEKMKKEEEAKRAEEIRLEEKEQWNLADSDFADTLEVARYYAESSTEEKQDEMEEMHLEKAWANAVEGDIIQIVSFAPYIEVAEEAKAEMEMIKKAIAEAEEEEKRKREEQIEEDRQKAILLSTQEEEKVYKRRKLEADAKKISEEVTARITRSQTRKMLLEVEDNRRYKRKPKEQNRIESLLDKINAQLEAKKLKKKRAPRLPSFRKKSIPFLEWLDGKKEPPPVVNISEVPSKSLIPPPPSKPKAESTSKRKRTYKKKKQPSKYLSFDDPSYKSDEDEELQQLLQDIDEVVIEESVSDASKTKRRKYTPKETNSE